MSAQFKVNEGRVGMVDSMNRVLRQAFDEAAAALDAFLADERTLKVLDELVERLTHCFQSGGKVLVAGNGGSMADAIHFAEEWTGRFQEDRRPFPAMALGEAAHLTCVGNDYGFDHVFSRLIQAFAKPEDVVILLSTSGKSKNLLYAADAARSCGSLAVALCGRGGEPLASRCDLAVDVPGSRSDRIQELHMLALHAVIDAVEHRLGVATSETATNA